MNVDNWKNVLQDWQVRVAAYQQGQHNAATSLERRYYLLGILVTVLVAITGTTVFANLNKDLDYSAKLTVVLVSLAAAVVSGLHTFLNYGKRADACRSISTQLGNIRREIDILRQFPPGTPRDKEKKLRELNKMLSDIAKDAPLITQPGKLLGTSNSEILPTGPTGPVEFSPMAKRALEAASRHTRIQGLTEVETIHLLGILEDTSPAVTEMLENLFPTASERKAFSESVAHESTRKCGVKDDPDTKLTLAESLEGAKETASSLALALDHPIVGTGHLFFGILATEGGKNLGRQVMLEAGLDKESVKNTVALVYATPDSFSNEI